MRTVSAETLDEASRSTLDRSLLMGLDVLCDGRRAFVNCTRDTLIKGLVTLLPSTSTVVEILETVPADPDVVRLPEPERSGILDRTGRLCGRRSPEATGGHGRHHQSGNETNDRRAAGAIDKAVRAVALPHAGGKSRNAGEFAAARDQGFVYFQGYFFRRPEMMTTHDLPANRMNYLRMLQEVSRPELRVPELEKLIKAEASVCYRLLRYLNSAIFGFQNEIHSVRHALSMLGERDVRRWVRLVAAVGAGQEKTSDLVLSALVRGRFGELLSPRVPHGESDLFLMGLLSLIDVDAGNADGERAR